MIKQVIVIRKDLKCRRGKECSQVAHASLGVFFQDLEQIDKEWFEFPFYDYKVLKEWLHTGTTKICVTVDSEQELLEAYSRAKALQLPVYMVTDAGRTEFHGVPTKTCLAIGPADSGVIDQITGKLKLY